MPRDQARIASGQFTLVREPFGEPGDGVHKAFASPVGGLPGVRRIGGTFRLLAGSGASAVIVLILSAGRLPANGSVVGNTVAPVPSIVHYVVHASNWSLGVYHHAFGGEEVVLASGPLALVEETEYTADMVLTGGWVELVLPDETRRVVSDPRLSAVGEVTHPTWEIAAAGDSSRSAAWTSVYSDDAPPRPGPRTSAAAPT
jgi:hypothetical protein